MSDKIYIDKLIKEELTSLLEYFHSAATGRQQEAQEYIRSRLTRKDLTELLRADRRHKLGFVRENFEEKFYWWADEDIKRMFDNWVI